MHLAHSTGKSWTMTSHTFFKKIFHFFSVALHQFFFLKEKWLLRLEVGGNTSAVEWAYLLVTRWSMTKVLKDMLVQHVFWKKNWQWKSKSTITIKPLRKKRQSHLLLRIANIQLIPSFAGNCRMQRAEIDMVILKWESLANTLSYCSCKSTLGIWYCSCNNVATKEWQRYNCESCEH